MTADASALVVVVERPGPERVEVRVSGELDSATAPQLWVELLAELGPEPRVVVSVDLGGVSFCSAAGISVLLRARARALEKGQALLVGRLSDAVRRVLRVAGLDIVLVEAGPLPTPRTDGTSTTSS